MAEISTHLSLYSEDFLENVIVFEEDSGLGSEAREKMEERRSSGHVLEMGWRIVG